MACFRSHPLFPQIVPRTTEAVGPIAKYRLKVLKGINDKVIFRNSSNNFCPFDYVLLAQTEPFFRPCPANEHVYFVS